MPFLLGGILGLIVVAVIAFTKGGTQTVSNNPPDNIEPKADVTTPSQTLAALYDEIGNARGVDPDVLHAICIQESREKPDAVRWNPPYDVSVGIAQVLCTPPAGATATDNYVCQNKLNVDGWPLRFNDLKDARTCLDIAAQILKWNLDTFGYPRGIAAYNDYAARHSPVDGPFPNQSYVDHVMANLAVIKGA